MTDKFLTLKEKHVTREGVAVRTLRVNPRYIVTYRDHTEDTESRFSKRQFCLLVLSNGDTEAVTETADEIDRLMEDLAHG